MSNRVSSFGLPRAGAASRHGGRIAIGDAGNLPIHFGADSYSVTPGGTLKALPEWASGRPLLLCFEGVSTIAHGGKIAAPGGADYQTFANDEMLMLPLGASGWQAVVLSTSVPLRTDQTQPLTDTQRRQVLSNLMAFFQGQCQLVKSGANLLLQRFGGRYLHINGALEIIPQGGVTLAYPAAPAITMTIASPCVVTWNNHGQAAGDVVAFTTTGALPTGIVAGQEYFVMATGLTANAFQLTAASGSITAINTSGSQSGVHSAHPVYKIYAFMNAGAMTLEASVTGHTTNATSGVEVKSTDATRSFVGLGFGPTGAWADTATTRYVRSFYNRMRSFLKNAFAATRSTTSTSLVEVNSEIRCKYLAFADDVVAAQFQARVGASAAGNRVGSAIGFDGSLGTGVELVPDGTGAYPVTVNDARQQSEGCHFVTMMGIVSTGTGTWAQGSTLTELPTLMVEVG